MKVQICVTLSSTYVVQYEDRHKLYHRVESHVLEDRERGTERTATFQR